MTLLCNLPAILTLGYSVYVAQYPFEWIETIRQVRLRFFAWFGWRSEGPKIGSRLKKRVTHSPRFAIILAPYVDFFIYD